MRLWEKRGVANSIGRPDKDLTIFFCCGASIPNGGGFTKPCCHGRYLLIPDGKNVRFMRIHESAAAKRLAPSDTRGRHSYHEKNGTALHPVQDGSV